MSKAIKRAFDASELRRLKVVRKVFDAANGPTALALLLGCGQSVVSNWLTRKRIPATRVLAVEKLTGISRHEIRPDVYGPK